MYGQCRGQTVREVVHYSECPLSEVPLYIIIVSPMYVAIIHAQVYLRCWGEREPSWLVVWSSLLVVQFKLALSIFGELRMINL